MVMFVIIAAAYGGPGRRQWWHCISDAHAYMVWLSRIRTAQWCCPSNLGHHLVLLSLECAADYKTWLEWHFLGHGKQNKTKKCVWRVLKGAMNDFPVKISGPFFVIQPSSNGSYWVLAIIFCKDAKLTTQMITWA